jgi:hypothetical protein
LEFWRRRITVAKANNAFPQLLLLIVFANFFGVFRVLTLARENQGCRLPVPKSMRELLQTLHAPLEDELVTGWKSLGPFGIARVDRAVPIA